MKSQLPVCNVFRALRSFQGQTEVPATRGNVVATGTEVVAEDMGKHVPRDPVVMETHTTGVKPSPTNHVILIRDDLPGPGNGSGSDPLQHRSAPGVAKETDETQESHVAVTQERDATDDMGVLDVTEETQGSGITMETDRLSGRAVAMVADTTECSGVVVQTNAAQDTRVTMETERTSCRAVAMVADTTKGSAITVETIRVTPSSYSDELILNPYDLPETGSDQSTGTGNDPLQRRFPRRTESECNRKFRDVSMKVALHVTGLVLSLPVTLVTLGVVVPLCAMLMGGALSFRTLNSLCRRNHYSFRNEGFREILSDAKDDLRAIFEKCRQSCLCLQVPEIVTRGLCYVAVYSALYAAILIGHTIFMVTVALLLAASPVAMLIALAVVAARRCTRRVASRRRRCSSSCSC